MKSRPKYGFSRYNDNGLADKAKRIHDLMSVIAVFNSPPVTFAALLILINNFKDAIVAALSRDELMVAGKREARENLENALRLNAGYIMGITTNYYEILETGYDAVIPGGPVGVPQVPQEVTGVSFGSQAIHIDWKRSYGAVNYVVSITDAVDPLSPSAVWTVKGYPTSSKILINEGLNPLTYYWVTVQANGAEGLSEASAPVRVLSV